MLLANKGPYSQGCGLPSGHIWLWELDHKEGRTPKNWCLQIVVLKKIPESPLGSNEIKPVNLKRDQPWIFTDIHWSWNSSILVIWYEQMAHWKSPWYWERSRAGEEGIRGWDGWVASLLQWTWAWVNSRRWWGIERSGVLQSVGFQRAGHNWMTEQQQCHIHSQTVPNPQLYLFLQISHLVVVQSLSHVQLFVTP